VRMGTRLLGAALVGGVGSLVALMARGRLTLDTGWGRTTTPVGPLTVRIAAPRPLVFDFIGSPYLGRTPRSARGHVDVWVRGSDMVVAAHHSKLPGYTAETVEAVQFERPERVTFRHLRGPVPYALETFDLVEAGDETVLEYRGEVGLDFWVVGALAARWWVVPAWERVVRESLDATREGVETLASARARRAEAPRAT
jgi:hypothetical protein